VADCAGVHDGEDAVVRIIALALLCVGLVACSGGTEDAAASGEAAAPGKLEGPYPKTVTGTIGYSFPLEDGSGDIELGLFEYDDAEIIVTEAVYTAKGMDEEDAEVTLSVTPIDLARCGEGAKQCFKGE
jgi:hypothetical protein